VSFQIFLKFAEILASEGAPPVTNLAQISTTLAANFATGTAGVDTGGAPRAAIISANFRKIRNGPNALRCLGKLTHI
jgi:hypothetical protein